MINAVAKRLEDNDKFIYFHGKGWAKKKTDLEESSQENSVRSMRSKVRCYKV